MSKGLEPFSSVLSGMCQPEQPTESGHLRFKVTLWRLGRIGVQAEGGSKLIHVYGQGEVVQSFRGSTEISISREFRLSLARVEWNGPEVALDTISSYAYVI